MRRIESDLTATDPESVESGTSKWTMAQHGAARTWTIRTVVLAVVVCSLFYGLIRPFTLMHRARSIRIGMTQAEVRKIMGPAEHVTPIPDWNITESVIFEYGLPSTVRLKIGAFLSTLFRISDPLDSDSSIRI